MRNTIENLLDTLLSADFAILRQPVLSQGSGNKRKITWPISPSVSAGSTEFGTIEEYQEQLNSSSYSAILLDGSILQIQYEFKRKKIVSHRLAFYPCPFRLEVSLLDEYQIRDVFEASRDLDLLWLRTPVRFDYAPHDTKEDHSASHLHFNHEECRIAVSAPLAPAEFVRFVAKNFYPNEWRKIQTLKDLPVTRGKRSIQQNEQIEWHLNRCNDNT